MKLSSYIIKNEKFIFFILIGLNLIPVLSGKFFPTMDGAAHLYNSNLINSLIFDKNIVLHSFFEINSEPVPNWSGHFILSFFNFFMPAFIAEKILLISYLIFLPLSYRALIKTTNQQNVLLSYFIFPFTYSFVFFLGFYNFSIALVLLIVTLNYWINNEERFNNIEPKSFLILLFLISATYFSHIFVFGILLFLLALQIIIKGTLEALKVNLKFKDVLFQLAKKAGILLLAAFLPLILFVNYFISRPPTNNAVYIPAQELMEWFLNIKPIIALNTEKEEIFTKMIFYFLLSILILAIFNAVKTIFNKYKVSTLNTVIKGFSTQAVFWVFSVISVLFLYFFLPDSNESAGYVSIRLGLMFFIFIVVLLSTQHYSKWVLLIGLVVVTVCNFGLNSYYSKAVSDLNHIAQECNKASEHIEPNSIVLPLNYSDNWLVGHFSNYLGIDKPMVILENYESSTGYFPVVWNFNSIPNTTIGFLRSSEFSCFNWITNEENVRNEIDYIFVLGSLESQNSCMIEIFEGNSIPYTVIYTSDLSSLIKLT